jgi:nitrogen regulatory protein P-II 1
MMNLTLIVHADVKQVLADVLRSLKPVSGFTFTAVEGHGSQDEHDAFLSARDRVVGYVPHVRVDILIGSKDVDEVLRALRAAGSSFAGRGIYWITPVDRHGRL